MVNRQVGKHALDGLIVAGVGLFEVLLEVTVGELDVGNGTWILSLARRRPSHFILGRRLCRAIREFFRGEASELHNVGGERACLVREDVGDLAELFVQVGGLDPGGHIALSIIDVNIPGDEHGLPELDDFNCDEQGDGHHVRE